MQRGRTGSPEGSSLTAVAWGAMASTALLVPFGSTQLAETVSFMPALISVVTCFDILSVCLLLGGYHDKGDLRLLVMAAAYSWSLVVMCGYALAFPGAVSQTPPLAATASTAPYLYVAWHAGFPVLLGIAAGPWPDRVRAVTAPGHRTRTAVQVIAFALVSSLALVALLVVRSDALPALIVGLDTHRMTTLTAPVVLPLVIGSLVLSRLGARDRSGPDRWCTVAILVCTCDLVLTYTSGHRFSLGWYGGRMLTLVASGVVVLSMLASFRRLAAQSEHDAVHDALTGLTNRRYAYAELDHLVARARRSSDLLGVVSLDLDHFKRINDEHGHETGDGVLRAVGQTLARGRRVDDVVARVGGEEFLLLLPGADEAGTKATAEALRRALASLVVPGMDWPMTASLGATTLLAVDRDSRDVLRRADDALYAAKRGGRDRVVMADPSPRPQLVMVDERRVAPAG